jgi:hypothetical protein
LFGFLLEPEMADKSLVILFVILVSKKTWSCDKLETFFACKTWIRLMTKDSDPIPRKKHTGNNTRLGKSTVHTTGADAYDKKKIVGRLFPGSKCVCIDGVKSQTFGLVLGLPPHVYC